MLVATLAGARVRLQVDVGFGDVVTPGAIEVTYPSLLDLPAPRLRAYPRETVVAEKLEATVQLGLANSRMKDFYDLVVLSRMIVDEIVRFVWPPLEAASGSDAFGRRWPAGGPWQGVS